jgi:hypothetical protein
MRGTSPAARAYFAAGACREYVYRAAMKTVRLALLLVLTCAACGVTHNLSRGEAIRPSPVKGILILGVNPPHHVQINTGISVSETTWLRDASGPEADLAPQDGYIVIDLDATTSDTEYGLTLVEPAASDYVYWACPKHPTITFQLPANKASYVGDVDFEVKPNAIEAKLSFNAERAKKFIERRYPALIPDFRPAPAHEKRVAFPSAPEHVAMKCLHAT